MTYTPSWEYEKDEDNAEPSAAWSQLTDYDEEDEEENTEDSDEED